MLTLDQVIKNYTIQKGFDSEMDYQRLYQIAVKGLEDLHYDLTGTPQYCKLTLNANGQADLPLDFMKLVRVGVIDKYGELISLGENQKLAYIQDTDDCGNPQRFPVQRNVQKTTDYTFGSNGNNYADHVNAHGETTGGFFGTTGRKTVGEYKINPDTNQIMVSNITTASILVVEYLANLSRIGEDYKVHEYLEEPLLNYMEWVSQRFKKSVGSGEKERLKMEYYRTKQNLRLQKFARNIDVLKQYYRKNNKQVKF